MTKLMKGLRKLPEASLALTLPSPIRQTCGRKLLGGNRREPNALAVPAADYLL
jgi:hypothetical protein